MFQMMHVSWKKKKKALGFILIMYLFANTIT